MRYDVKATMEELKEFTKFMNNNTEEPWMYNGEILEQKQFNDRKVWMILSREHLKIVINNVEQRVYKI